jgi:dTDP-4-amino-4,6-dideoxygalactose transaminase/predicted dehydrogenase
MIRQVFVAQEGPPFDQKDSLSQMASLVKRAIGRAQREWRARTIPLRSPLRAAIIGYGGIAPSHAWGYELSGRAMVVAVSDVRPEALAAAASKQPRVRTFRDYRQLLEELRPDVISICTWPRLRREIVELAAECGVKGILCEKPMALTMAEVDALREICKKAGIRLAVGHQSRFHPTFAAAAERIRAGKIGKLLEAQGEIASTLANNGPHLLDVSRYLLGDPQAHKVRCECERRGASFNRGLPAEDGASGEIQFAGNLTFKFQTGDRAGEFFRVQVVGTSGTIEVTPKKLLLNGKSGGSPKTDEDESRRRQFTEFIEWVKAERSEYRADGEQAAQSTELMLAAYESARLGREVELPLSNRGEVITLLYPDQERGSLAAATPGQTQTFPVALMDKRLALNGGVRSVTKWFSTKPHLGAAELAALTRVVVSGALNCLSGTVVSEMEKAFAKAYGCPKAVASTSGTAALHVALAAVNPEPGSEIITTPLTDMGTVIPILWSGCIPAFADIDPATGNCTVETIAARITPRTRAVMLVHLFGRPADPGPVADLCRQRGIVLIEDCSQAHFAEYQGKKVGTFGALGCLSLQQSKQITCGDGGVTLINDEQYAHRAALFVDKAWNRKAAMRAHEFLGINYRMTELQGAVALAQLSRLPGLMEARRRAAGQLSKRLEGLPGIRLPSAEGVNPAWWKFNFTIDSDELGLSADQFAGALMTEGVVCQRQYLPRPLFEEDVIRDQKTFGTSRYPFNLNTDYQPPRMDDFPGYREFDRIQVMLPWSSRVRSQHVEQIASAIGKVVDVAAGHRPSRAAIEQRATVEAGR